MVRALTEERRMHGTPQIHLEGKVAIVTGASRGIGEAIARSFARHGAKVVLASRKLDGLERVAREIEAEGGEALAVAAHTGHEGQVAELVARAVAHFGKVDVLVNNAATNPYFGPMMNVDAAAWDKTFEVNVKGYFTATREVVRHLYSRNAPGAIVNVASVAGLMGSPLQGVYGMTKASVISMTRTLAMELGTAGIRVNAIAPGLVETKFASALTTNDAVLAQVMERTALKRLGQPDEISGAALYLASDAASFMTGHVLTIDAGWTVGI
jgi:NAD(P)-dependent dehydrogenase (short-subunit alcohol dehydrogenase family)